MRKVLFQTAVGRILLVERQVTSISRLQCVPCYDLTYPTQTPVLQCDFHFDLFLVLVLVAVFEIFFSFSFVLVFIIFSFQFFLQFQFSTYFLVLVQFQFCTIFSFQFSFSTGFLLFAACPTCMSYLTAVIWPEE